MGNKEYYNALAPYYEAVTNKPGAWMPNTYALMRLKTLIKDQPDSVLDLGAGTGQTTELIRRLYPVAPVTAVDFSKLMLEILSAKNLNCTAIESDIAEFVHDAQDSWQLIVAIGSFEFIPRLPDLIDHIYRKLLTPGGIFTFTYEPLLSDHPGQDKKITNEKAGAALNHETITTFRYKPQSVTKVLLKQKAIIEVDEEFIAYHKGERAVMYRLVVIKKQAYSNPKTKPHL